MATPKETVLDIEMKRLKKQLSKSAICRRAGISNAIYSYVLNRGFAGEQLNPEHVSKIMTAIKDAPVGEK